MYQSVHHMSNMYDPKNDMHLLLDLKIYPSLAT